MKKFFLGAMIMIIIPLALFLTPVGVVEAQGPGPGGFLTCNGPDCSFCNLVHMANIIIKWLFGFMFLLFAVMMVMAGVGLITSGGDTVALDNAKSKFRNAIIGVIIVMAAWLLVDTIMRGLLKGGTGEIDGWGPWMDVQCQDQAVAMRFVDLNTGHGRDGQVTGGAGDPSAPVNQATNPGSCSIPGLSPITDPLAREMEQGRTVIFNNATLEQCVNKFIGEVGGHVNSAYRPPEYQTHLYEIRDRWCTKNLRNNTQPECSALKSAVQAEVNKHFGSNWACGSVAKNSKHSSGLAVDIGGINHAATRSVAESHCLIWKNYPGDPWHYDLKEGCTCS